MLTADNYYTDTEYFSVSKYKQYKKCELGGKENNFVPTEAMLIGSYVDAFVEGTLDQFIIEHPEIISSRGITKGELKASYVNADLICQKIQNDPVFSQFMSGEKQTIMTGEIGGVPWKIKMDSYSPHIAINDLKVMASVTTKDGEFYDFITPWGYDIQLACYQEIVYQNTGERLPCFICAVTKETPTNSVIINIPQSYLNKALYLVEETAMHFWEVEQGVIEPVGCDKCATCIKSRTQTPIISLGDINGEY